MSITVGKTRVLELPTSWSIAPGAAPSCAWRRAELRRGAPLPRQKSKRRARSPMTPPVPGRTLTYTYGELCHRICCTQR